MLALALRSYRVRGNLLVLPALAVAVATAGKVLVESYGTLVRSELSRDARGVTGADVSIQGRRRLSPEESAQLAAWMREGTLKRETTETLEFLSMARHPRSAQNRLVEVHTISAGYPLYGTFELEPAGALATDAVAIHPDLRAQLGIELGDQLELGRARFRVQALVRADSTAGLSFFSIGPRVWIRSEALASTGLEQVGSRISYQTLLRETPPPDPVRVEILSEEIARLMPSDLRVRSYARGNRRAQLFTNRLERFLSLVGAFGLLCALGGVFLGTQSHLRKQEGLLKLLVELGASSAQRTLWIGLELGSVLALGVGAGLALGVLGAALGAPLLAELAPVQGSGLLSRSLALAAPRVGLEVTLLLLAVVVPPLVSRLQLSKAYLLLPALSLLAFAVAGCGLKGWEQGIVLGIAAGSLALAFGVGQLLRALLLRWRPSVGLGAALRLGALSLVRHRARSGLTILLLTLATTLLLGLEAIQARFRAELGAQDAVNRPDLFLIDVAEDDQKAVEQVVAAGAVAPRFKWSKMVRGRWEKHNSVAPTREGRDGEDEDVRGGNEINLSEREALYESESATRSPLWDPEEPRPEVSLEAEFAKRWGVKVGDEVSFSILGVPIDFVVTSLRRVRWSTFQPNFFIIVEPGTLEGAPFQWIAAISGLDGADADGADADGELKARVQARLTRSFPTLTVIDVRDASEKLLAIVRKIELAARALAELGLLGVVFILIMTAVESAAARRGEVNLLRVLGASRAQVLATLCGESLLLGLAGVTAGVLLAQTSAWLILENFFSLSYVFHPGSLLWALGVLAIVVSTAVVVAWRISRDLPKGADMTLEPVLRP